MDSISARAIAECTSAEAATALVRSFESYFVPVNVTAQTFERRFRAEHLDPFSSRIYYAGDSASAVLLVTRRGWSSRIAAVGVVPEMRGRGLGRRIMNEALADARTRGDRSVCLEVIEENVAALSLYEALGFRARRRLVGYDCASAPPATEGADAVAEIDPLEFARFAAREAESDLPWMLTAETYAAATFPARAYRLEGRACALIANSTSETLTLAGLVVGREERRSGWGSRLLRGLAAVYPGRAWTIPAIVPEHLCEDFFAHNRWERQTVTQLEMRVELL